MMNERGTEGEVKKEEVNERKREREVTPENKGEQGKRINEITQKSQNILPERGT